MTKVKKLYSLEKSTVERLEHLAKKTNRTFSGMLEETIKSYKGENGTHS